MEVREMFMKAIQKSMSVIQILELVIKNLPATERRQPRKMKTRVMQSMRELALIQTVQLDVVPTYITW